MEKEGRTQRACRGGAETDFVLQWGNRKRLRCFKVKDGRQEGSVRRRISIAAGGGGGGGDVKESQYANCFNRNSDSGVSENRKSHASSPEKEDRYYTTRGSCGGNDENGKVLMEGCGGEERGYVLPKFFMTLSSKEKEEDFMAMKGCKLPQRPKKRAKFIQKCLLLVTPGAWLSDLSHERYEVREKKCSRKLILSATRHFNEEERRRGLKAMAMESESE